MQFPGSRGEGRKVRPGRNEASEQRAGGPELTRRHEAQVLALGSLEGPQGSCVNLRQEVAFLWVPGVALPVCPGCTPGVWAGPAGSWPKLGRDAQACAESSLEQHGSPPLQPLSSQSPRPLRQG